MSKLTKLLRKDWNEIQGHWPIGFPVPHPTPKGRFKAFCVAAGHLYNLSPKEVKNRVQP
jgi:hypothetical protein